MTDAMEPIAVEEAPAPVAQVPPTPVPIMDGEAPLSNAQPVWQFVLLYICVPLYDIIWFYRNWHLLKRERRLHVVPLIRALLSAFFSVPFMRNAFTLATERGYETNESPFQLAMLYSAIVITCIAINIFRLIIHDRTLIHTLIMITISTAKCLFLIPTVKALNHYWQYEQPGYRPRSQLSPGAIVGIIVGVFWWYDILASTIRYSTP
jgi:hypothetical protein